MNDETIAAEIGRQGLEMEYLSGLASALGFSLDAGWTEEMILAIEVATPEQRRAAALRTLRLSEE